MTIDEAIKARIERFNRLYKKATGHTFEEDPEWCKQKEAEELVEWQKKVDVYLAKLSLPNLDEFYATLPEREDCCGYDWSVVDEDFKELLWHKPHHSSNYGYEMMVIDQAKEIANFLISKGDPKEMWDKYAKDESGKYIDIFKFVENLQADGFDKWDDGHSGNSAGAAIMFANSLIFEIEIFPYLHGALALLVGDEGYHDDRSDLPKKPSVADEITENIDVENLPKEADTVNIQGTTTKKYHHAK